MHAPSALNSVVIIQEAETFVYHISRKSEWGKRVAVVIHRPLCYYFDREPVCAHSRRNGYVEEARSFAEKAHEGQFRKGTKRPYIVHPLEVAKIVSTMTDDEEIISAALLHDTLEDCRQVTKEQIKEAFGERVLEMVRQESEDKSKTWWREKVRQSDI